MRLPAKSHLDRLAAIDPPAGQRDLAGMLAEAGAADVQTRYAGAVTPIVFDLADASQVRAAELP